jgi:hypothetical protein
MPGAGRTRRACGLKRKVPTSRYRQAETSGTPCAMALRLLRALPGVPGLLASVAAQIALQQLDPSVGGTGPHGLTVRAGHARLAQLLRPSHPASRSVTIGLTPLLSRRDDAMIAQFAKNGSKIFAAGGVADSKMLNRHAKLIFTRTRF